ncbi:hypothetical protein A3860_04285 [Niastella vici]|uniref:Uncharacterized protein n=1 Tax=Niastella vici TaxID=1703345 RepID=A0A1V9FRI6_9BACT|nr:hypothetical protein A3860_04285 [Niastella vici]
MQNKTNDCLVKLCTWLGFKADRPCLAEPSRRRSGGPALLFFPFYITVPVRLPEGVKTGAGCQSVCLISRPKNLVYEDIRPK